MDIIATIVRLKSCIENTVLIGVTLIYLSCNLTIVFFPNRLSSRLSYRQSQRIPIEVWTIYPPPPTGMAIILSLLYVPMTKSKAYVH